MHILYEIVYGTFKYHFTLWIKRKECNEYNYFFVSPCPWSVFKGIIKVRIETRHLNNALRCSNLCTTLKRIRLVLGAYPQGSFFAIFYAFYVRHMHPWNKTVFQKKNQTKRMRLNLGDKSQKWLLGRLAIPTCINYIS